MSAPKFITADTPIVDRHRTHGAEHVSSLFVLPRGAAATAAPRPEETGIITERDVLRAIAERGADALAMPAEAATSWPLAAVAADAFVYRAIGRMSRLKVRHLGVTDARARLSARCRRAIFCGCAPRKRCGWATRSTRPMIAPALAARLVEAALARRLLVPEGVSGRDVAAVISARSAH